MASIAPPSLEPPKSRCSPQARIRSSGGSGPEVRIEPPPHRIDLPSCQIELNLARSRGGYGPGKKASSSSFSCQPPGPARRRRQQASGSGGRQAQRADKKPRAAVGGGGRNPQRGPPRVQRWRSSRSAAAVLAPNAKARMRPPCWRRALVRNGDWRRRVQRRGRNDAF